MKSGNEIDDLIDAWHDLPESDPLASLPLHTFIGMTLEQWDEWVTGTQQ